MNMARNVGIFIGLAALSFVLGFFVLARLVPGAAEKPTLDTSALVPAATAGNTSHSAELPAAPPAETDRTPAGTADLPGAHKVAAAPGPSLDPQSDAPALGTSASIQQPRKIDEPHSPTKATDEAAQARKGEDPGSVARQGGDATLARKKPRASADDEQKADPPAEQPESRPRKRRHAAALDSTAGELRSPGDTPAERNGDSTVTGEPRAAASRRRVDTGDDGFDPPPTRRRSVSNAPSATLYHVHIGSFHSLDDAEREVKRARSHGFEPQIVPTTSHSGRKLFRVQVGAYRDRERAATVQQQLQDASLDARISE